MNSTKRLIPLACYLLFLLTNAVDAENDNAIGFTVGGPATEGDGSSSRAGGFGGFGTDALCALCIRIGNYQCYLRYCSSGRGGTGGMGNRGGSYEGGGGGGGGGGGRDIFPPVPWNPTCAMCMTAACRRLWCASGRAGTGNVFYPGGNNFIGNGYGTRGGFAPSAYYPNNYGVSSGYMNRVIVSKYKK
ncbi:uncharacterized protein LOC110458900 [Mizuhopecten yessoensis]|uniref:uncharacterized protein LOC110458900 n=1 Tax=Mizuhopecten yessoensis TaxID=6573 RepID=UPI000B45ADE3|nr:uncharacterized protein LOC110458900 [Mizuhopecten yessoensis]